MTEIPRIETRQQLVALAKELKLRPDWHNPDERNIDAEVLGDSFNNAGFWPEVSAVPGSTLQEVHVRLYRVTETEAGDLKEPIAAVNLATLFSWACGHEES